MLTAKNAMVVVATECSSELDNIELLRACLKSMLVDKMHDVDWQLEYLAEGEGWTEADYEAAHGERAAYQEKLAKLDSMRLSAMRDLVLGAL